MSLYVYEFPCVSLSFRVTLPVPVHKKIKNKLRLVAPLARAFSPCVCCVCVCVCVCVCESVYQAELATPLSCRIPFRPEIGA